MKRLQKYQGSDNMSESVWDEYYKDIIKYSDIQAQLLKYEDFFITYLIPNECQSYVMHKRLNLPLKNVLLDLFIEIAQLELKYLNFGYFIDRETGGGEWMWYNENTGVWERNVEIFMDSWHITLLNFLKLSPSDENIKTMMKQLRQLTIYDIALIDANENIITFQNGVLELDSWTLRLPEKSDFSTQLIPHRCILDARLPKDKKNWIYNLCSSTLLRFPKMTIDDLLDLMLGYPGYCMTKRNNLGKFEILYSKKGGSGKTTWMEIIKNIVGQKLFTELELDELVEQDFKQAFLAGKLLNVHDDLNGKIIRSEGKLKSMMTARSMTINGKFEKPRNVKKTDKHMYACNEFPFIKRIDLAYARRPKVLFFENYIPEEEQDIEFIDKLLSDEIFMEQLIAECLLQYKSLLARNNVQFGQSQEDMLHMWRMETDVIYQFIHLCCDKTSDEGRWHQQPVLYDYFTTFCEIHGHQPLDQRIFTETLGKLNYPKVQRREEKGRVWKYKGIAMKEEFLESEKENTITTAFEKNAASQRLLY